MKFVRRFTLADRRLHWITAAGFTLLLISGIIMYFVGSWSGSPQKVSHFLGGMVFFFTPLFYLYKVKDKRKDWLFIFKWTKLDFEWFNGLFNKTKVAQGKYNALQKLSFLFAVIFGLVSSITGVILIFLVTDTLIFIHNIGTIALLSFFILHGTLYILKPFRRTLRSMLKGIMDVKYAEEHHQLWFEKVKATAFSPGANMQAAKGQQAQNISE